MTRTASVFKFALLGGMTATAVSASVGVTTWCIGHLARWQEFRSIWPTWWLGDATGALLLTPFLLLWSTRSTEQRKTRRPLEAAALLLCLLFVTGLVFSAYPGLAAQHYPLEFLCIPPLIWAAFRFGPRATATTITFLSAIAIWQTLHGFGPFARPGQNESLLLLQAFTGVVAVLSLGLAAVVLERSEKERSLLAAHSAAESLVQQRTADLMATNAILEEELQRRFRAEGHLRASEERYRLLFARNLAGILRTTLDGRVLECNQAFAKIVGYSSPEEVLRVPMRDLYLNREDRAAMVGAVLQQRELTNLELSFRRNDGSPRWVLANLNLVDAAGDTPATITGNIIDITKIKQTQEQLRRLSAKLMRSQDDERRKVARELHDSLGQYLAALTMNLDVLDRASDGADPKLRGTVLECIAMCEKCLADTRTLSHLLHPPLLDDLGLETALRLYIEGFAKRSGIKVAIEISPQLGRLSSELETALFRIVQETLTNIHRHSGSATAKIQLEVNAGAVVLKVSDEGRGLPSAMAAAHENGIDGLGLGIVGMRERVKEFGGQLEITWDERGTVVQTILPLSLAASVGGSSTAS